MPSNILYKERIASDILRIWQCEEEVPTVAIAGNMSIVKLKKNELVYREGQRPTVLFYLVSGKVKIVKECGLGRAQIVRAVKQQQFLGYRAFFAKECYTTSAMAFEDSVVATLPLDMAVGMMDGHSSIARYFMYDLSTILGMTDGRIVSLTQKHIRGRLADTILDLMDNYGTDEEHGVLNIMMNRDDLASMSNMSTSNAIRTLSAFANEGMVNVEGKKIRILDEEKLRRVSRLG